MAIRAIIKSRFPLVDVAMADSKAIPVDFSFSKMPFSLLSLFALKFLSQFSESIEISYANFFFNLTHAFGESPTFFLFEKLEANHLLMKSQMNFDLVS